MDRMIQQAIVEVMCFICERISHIRVMVSDQIGHVKKPS